MDTKHPVRYSSTQALHFIFEPALLIAAALCFSVETYAEGYMGTNGMLPHGVYFERTYSGKIGDKYSVTMKLQRSGAWVSGNYSYAGKKSTLLLNGKIDAAGNVTLEENIGPSTGKWNGRFSKDTFTGQWSRPDGSGKMAFLLNKTSEQALETKKEVLQAAIGTFDLDDIEGTSGANGMFSIMREGGRWDASSSGISAGMRQGGGYVLSKREIQLLDSMHITVDASLKTSFYAGDKLLIVVPFTERGMLYEVNTPLRDGTLDKIKDGDIYVDANGALYLAILDGIDYSDAFFMGGSIEAVHGRKNKFHLVLTYSPYHGGFGIAVNPVGWHGDSSKLSFVRRK